MGDVREYGSIRLGHGYLQSLGWTTENGWQLDPWEASLLAQVIKVDAEKHRVGGKRSRKLRRVRLESFASRRGCCILLSGWEHPERLP